MIKSVDLNLLTANRYQAHCNPICGRDDDIRSVFVTLPCPPTTFLNSFKHLTHPCSCVRHLSQREILTKTNPWPSIEGKIRPGFRCPFRPPRGIEVIDTWTKHVFSPLHPQWRIVDGSSFRYCDGLLLSAANSLKARQDLKGLLPAVKWCRLKLFGH